MVAFRTQTRGWRRTAKAWVLSACGLRTEDMVSAALTLKQAGTLPMALGSLALGIWTPPRNGFPAGTVTGRQTTSVGLCGHR